MIGVYLHIPFCVKKCYYCDFVSFQGENKLKEKYINALISEIENAHLENYEINTVYIGGGTPSILSCEDIERVLKKITKNIKGKAEITIEANPGTLTEDKLKKYLQLKINRLSIGLQSTQNSLLKEIGRIHTYEDFIKMYSLARSVRI